MKLLIPRLLPLALFSLNLGATETAPLYQNSILTIPRVDLPDRVAQYQNVQFRRASDGRWDLIHINENEQVKIETVAIEKIDYSKGQLIFLKVSGNLPNACFSLGEAFTRRDGNNFTVAVNQVALQTLVACTQALVPFETTIPLDVYGLSNGNYAVKVNTISQSFALDKVVAEISAPIVVKDNTTNQ